MKIIALILSLQLLVSCTDSINPPDLYVKGHSTSDSEIYYIKDTRSGLCFAERNYGTAYSFTCVPCDSIKNFIPKK